MKVQTNLAMTMRMTLQMGSQLNFLEGWVDCMLVCYLTLECVMHACMRIIVTDLIELKAYLTCL